MPKIRTIQAGADPAVLAARIARQHVADIVEILNALPRETAAGILAYLPHEQMVGVFDEPQFDAAAEFIQRLPTQQASAVLSEISADRAADILRNVNEPERSQLLSLLDPETQTSLRELLSYLRDTAGSLMTTEFVAVPATWTVEATLQHIRDVERMRETVISSIRRAGGFCGRQACDV